MEELTDRIDKLYYDTLMNTERLQKKVLTSTPTSASTSYDTWETHTFSDYELAKMKMDVELTAKNMPGMDIMLKIARENNPELFL